MEDTEVTDGTAPALSAARPRTRKRLIGALVALVGLVVIAGAASIATLNSAWLKDQLVAKASTALGAELRVADVHFSPFRGAATLVGLDLQRHTDDSDLSVRVAQGELDVCVVCLVFRKLKIKRLELQAPEIVAVRRRPADAPAEGTVDKLKRLVDKRLNQPRPRDQRPPVPWEVARLIIHDGALDYTSVQEGRQPFRAHAADFEYSGTDISLSSLHRMLYGADISSAIAIGGTARLDKRGSASPSTCTFEGLNMAALDPLFDQADALVVTGGAMNLNYVLGSAQEAAVHVTLENLQLGRNVDAANQQFMFIPVERIVDYVAGKGGKIELSFTLAGDAAQHSDDLDALAREFWQGMWIAILKEVSPGSVDELVEQGKGKARDVLQGLRDKASAKGEGETP